MPKSPELKPCPFCGSTIIRQGLYFDTPETQRNSNPKHAVGYLIACVECAAQITYTCPRDEIKDYREILIQRWNTRTTPRQHQANSQKQHKTNHQARQTARAKAIHQAQIHQNRSKIHLLPKNKP